MRPLGACLVVCGVLLVPVSRAAERPKLDARLRVPGAGAPLRVYVEVAGTTPAVLAALAAHGLEVELVNAELGLVQGRVAPERLGTLAALPLVTRVRPADRARRRSGAVTSEGDAAARGDVARATGLTGAGVVVGVISDGVDGLAEARAAGELPALTVPSDPRCRLGSGDEGTALLEIVHDLAPGAALLVSGAATSLEFIDAVRCLVAAGAHVIVDDLGFFGEPFFAVGPVARAVREAVARGVVFVSAAGNDALGHVEQYYRTGTCPGRHHWNLVDCTNEVVLAPGETLECVLQWNDPFAESANDYDLVVVDEAGAPLAAGDAPQDGLADPIEEVAWTNPDAAARTVALEIRRVHGEGRLLELFCAGGAMRHVTPAGSVVGHPALPEAIAVGAIDVLEPGLDVVEPFGSRGPARFFFPLATVPKPDLVAFDFVSTSRPGFAPFAGTSAAAPHVAAVAALLLEKNRFLSSARVREALVASAVDLRPRGADPAAGAGRLDAAAALALVPSPECVADGDCDPTATCPIDTCREGICAHSEVRGLGAPACVQERVPRAVAQRFARACHLAATRLNRRAAAVLARAAGLVRRAAGGRLSRACSDAVGASLARARRRLDQVGAP